MEVYSRNVQIHLYTDHNRVRIGGRVKGAAHKCQKCNNYARYRFTIWKNYQVQIRDLHMCSTCGHIKMLAIALDINKT